MSAVKSIELNALEAQMAALGANARAAARALAVTPTAAKHAAIEAAADALAAVRSRGAYGRNHGESLSFFRLDHAVVLFDAPEKNERRRATWPRVTERTPRSFGRSRC